MAHDALAPLLGPWRGEPEAQIMPPEMAGREPLTRVVQVDPINISLASTVVVGDDMDIEPTVTNSGSSARKRKKSKGPPAPARAIAAFEQLEERAKLAAVIRGDNWETMFAKTAELEKGKCVGADGTVFKYFYTQENFRVWCAEKKRTNVIGFEDGDTVNQHKMLRFEKYWCESGERVNRPKSKKKTDRDKSSPSTMKGVVFALKNLWRVQKALGVNSHPDPNLMNETVKTYIQTHESAEAKLSEELKEDVDGSLLDGFTTFQELKDLMRTIIKNNNRTGVRNRFLCLVSFAFLSRSQNILTLRLQYLAAIKIQARPKAPHDLDLFSCLMRTGKTNKASKPQYGHMIRSNDWELCPVGAMAQHFFQRFHVDQVKMPSLKQKDCFGDAMSPPSDLPQDRQNFVTYAAFYKKLKSMFLQLNMDFSKATHIFRQCGSRMLGLGGVSYPSIQLHGRWNNQVLATRYNQNVPVRECMENLAAFDGDPPNYPRGAIQPPTALTNLIFPFINAYLEDSTLITRSGTTTRGIVAAFAALRIFLVQDAVLWRQHYPDFSLFQHDLFHRDDFLAFEVQMKSHLQRVASAPSSESISSAPSWLAPLTSVMSSGFGDLQTRLSATQSHNASPPEVLLQLQELKTDIRNNQSHTSAHMREFSYGLSAIASSLASGAAAVIAPLAAHTTLLDPHTAARVAAFTLPSSQAPGLSAAPSSSSSASPYDHLATLSSNPSDPSASSSSSILPSPSALAPLFPVPRGVTPRYHMKHKLKTVAEVYMEYKLHTAPLEAEGIDWRRDGKVSKLWSKRLPINLEVCRLISEHPNPHSVVAEEAAVRTVQAMWKKGTGLEPFANMLRRRQPERSRQQIPEA